MKLSDDTADKLLDLLSSDDAFRATFQKDPRAALASIGHAPAADADVAEGAWDCCAVGALASKDDIAKARGQLRQMFVASKMGYQPIALETSRR